MTIEKNADKLILPDVITEAKRLAVMDGDDFWLGPRKEKWITGKKKNQILKLRTRFFLREQRKD